MPVIFAETSYAADYRWVKRSAIVLNMPRLESLPQPARERVGSAVRCLYRWRGPRARQRGHARRPLCQLHQRGVDVGWECIGPGWPPSHLADLRRRADQAGLRDVRFHGYVPAHEGWEIVRRCQIGLAVLLPLPNIVESYPTKLFEYMTLEMPVITSAFPLYQAVVDRHECGMCVNPDSVEELAEAIDHLIQHPEEAAAMGRRGRQAVLQEYNWDDRISKAASVLRTTVVIWPYGLLRPGLRTPGCGDGCRVEKTYREMNRQRNTAGRRES